MRSKTTADTYNYNYKPVNYAVLSGDKNYYVMTVNRVRWNYNITLKINNKNYLKQVNSKCISRGIGDQSDTVMSATLNPVNLHFKDASHSGKNIFLPKNSFCLFTFSK